MSELETVNLALQTIRDLGITGFLALMFALERSERQRARDAHLGDLRRLAGYENKPNSEGETQTNDKRITSD